MARKRMIDPSFWTDEKLGLMTIEIRLLFMGLISNADDEGRLSGHPALIRSIVFPYDSFSIEDVQKWLENLAENELIYIYKFNNQTYIEVKNFKIYQTINKPTPSKHPSYEEYLMEINKDKQNNGDLKPLHDDYGNTTVVLPPNRKEEKRKEEKRIEDIPEKFSGDESNSSSQSTQELFDEESTEFRLANSLYKKIIANNPKAKEPNLQKWAKEIDYMIRLDKRSPKEIHMVIDWCQKDSFWLTNILSTKNLRKHYDQLYLQMKQKSNKIQNKSSPSQRPKDYKDQRKYDSQFLNKFNKTLKFGG